MKLGYRRVPWQDADHGFWNADFHQAGARDQRRKVRRGSRLQSCVDPRLAHDLGRHLRVHGAGRGKHQKDQTRDGRGDCDESDTARDGAFDRDDQPTRTGARDFRIRHWSYGPARDGTAAGQAGGVPRAGARDSRSAPRRRSDLQHRRVEPQDKVPASRSALYQPRRPDSAVRRRQRSQDAGARGRVWRRCDHDWNHRRRSSRRRAQESRGGSGESGTQRGEDAASCRSPTFACCDRANSSIRRA